MAIWHLRRPQWLTCDTDWQHFGNHCFPRVVTTGYHMLYRESRDCFGCQQISMVKHTVVANFLHLVCQDFFTRHWKVRHKLDCLWALFVVPSETCWSGKAQHLLSKPTLSVCRQVAMVHANYRQLLYLPADKAITRRFLVQNPLCDWFYLTAFSKRQQPVGNTHWLANRSPGLYDWGLLPSVYNEMHLVMSRMFLTSSMKRKFDEDKIKMNHLPSHLPNINPDEYLLDAFVHHPHMSKYHDEDVLFSHSSKTPDTCWATMKRHRSAILGTALSMLHIDFFKTLIAVKTSRGDFLAVKGSFVVVMPDWNVLGNLFAENSLQE